MLAMFAVCQCPRIRASAMVMALTLLSAAALAAESATSHPEKAMPAASSTASFAMPTVEPFGRLPDGREAHLYTLTVPGGWKATITDYGAILTSFLVPPRADDPAGKPTDVVLGFDTLDGYLAGHPYFGAICGRYSNRIARGKFELDGTTYTLATNNGENHLHGGVEGFDKKLWTATPHVTEKGPAVSFERVSPDGEEGYPGTLHAKATYTLTPAGELIVEMQATTDAPTILNLVNHSYWNLAGHGSGSIRDHELAVEADRYVPVDAGAIPTGSLELVEGTSFDFRPERKPLGRCGPAIDTLPPNAKPGDPLGVDHAYAIRDWKPDGSLRKAATFRDPNSGRTLEVFSNQPAVQVYMGGFLDGTLTGKGGAVYVQNGGLCLETETFPDSPNHPEWPSPRLEPGQTYQHTMVHRLTP